MQTIPTFRFIGHWRLMPLLFLQMPLLFLMSFIFVGCSVKPPSETAPTRATVAEAPSLASGRDGSVAAPLMVLVVPDEGQSAANALGGLKPAFDAITKSIGLHFDSRAGDSYAAVVEGIATRKGDLAYLGPYTYVQARDRGAAELLCVAVRNGTSHYYAGIFARTDSGINSLRDLKGKAVAFGDVNSTSSYNYPCAMMLAAGVDPSRDLSRVILAGNHANSLAALAAGKVDACCAMISSFEAAVKKGLLDPNKIKIVAKSEPIPGSPLVMHPALPANIKEALRQAFRDLDKNPNLGPDGLRGEDGKPLDRFDTTITDAEYSKAMKFLEPVTDEMKAAMLQKAAKN